MSHCIATMAQVLNDTVKAFAHGILEVWHQGKSMFYCWVYMMSAQKPTQHKQHLIEEVKKKTT